MHPMIAHILRNPAQRAALERALAARGNKGDSMIAHINPQEAGLLKQAGGSGTVNPRTGLLQFDAPGFGGGGNSGGYGGGNNGGFGKGGQDSGGHGNGGGGLLGGTGIMGGASGAYNSTSQLGLRDPITSAALNAQNDYHNVGNTGLDNFGNLIASGFGFNEIDPTKANVTALNSGVVPSDRASWGFDPAGLLGGAVGLAVGAPFGGGLLANQISKWAGRPMQINMGPDVFGGGSSSGGTFGASGPNNAGGNVGANGGGQHDGSGAGMGGMGGNPGGTGNPGGAGTPGAPGTTPAPAVPPAGTGGLPPGVTSLIMQYLAQMQGGDPFKGRFGPMPSTATQPYAVGLMPNAFPVPRPAGLLG